MSGAPPDLISGVPVYQEFFSNHDGYERYHIHVIGLVAANKGGGEKRGTTTAALKTRRNWFGVPRVIDAVADPYVTVETVGPNTGSTDYFPIGHHELPVLRNCQTPLWDAKCLLIAKKGESNTEGLQFVVLDKNRNRQDKELFRLTLDRSELPPTTLLKDSIWTSFSRPVTGSSDDLGDGITFEFRIMVTDGADRIVSHEQTVSIYQEMAEGYSYSELVIESDTGDQGDNALLQCWRHEENHNKAVFWVLGRNDCFMHPHVATKLFAGYDIYVLNYKMNGHCRKQGWVTDPHYNSHNKKGDFNVYVYDIAKSLEKIAEYDRSYDTFVGYAHSTGGPILLNYLMEKGDAVFDAFIFNSPFLDWGFVGGDMIEFVLESTGVLSNLGIMENDAKVGTAATPEALKDTPIVYLNQEIVYSAWSARLWSLYDFDFETRPLYKVPMTVGFAKGVTEVHEKMNKWHESKRAITAKPFLCITSRGDDVLKAAETLHRVDWIGPGRWEIELNDNGHDVFLSSDQADTEMAIDMCLTWMKNKRLT